MKKITLFFSLLAMMFVGLQAQAADVYTVCGSSSALFGNTWDPTNTANDMTLQDGSYVLVKENVALNSGLIEYKVVKNHVWGEGEVPSSGNKSFSIAESGTYNVTFKLSDSELAADVQLVSESPVQFDATARKFAVTGAAFGGWNMPPTEAQTFTNNGDGTYTLKYEGATAGYFKLSSVAADVDFTSNWDEVFNPGTLGFSPLVEGDNILSNSFGSGNMTFPVSGNVTLTISDVTESSCKLNIAVNEVVVPDKAWYIAGNFTDWESGKLALVGNDDGTFSITVQGVQAGAEFKFINENGGWFGGLSSEVDINPGHCTDIDLVDGDNFKISSGGGDLTFTIDAENKLTVTGWDYLLHYGTTEEGAVWQDAIFVAGEGENEGKLVAKDVEFAANTQFGIKYGDIWYAGFANINDDTANDNAYVIHANWCTNIPLNTANDPHEPNLSLKNFLIKQAGTYTFVLTVGENGITMDVEGFPVAPVLGDLNGDGKADVTDVNIIVNMILGKQAKTEAGNLNGDDDVDVTDVNLLVNIILGKSGDTTGEGE